MVIGLAAPSPASAAKFLNWRPGPRIDRTELTAVACPGTSLCVAVDGAGRILASTHPSARHPHWSDVYMGAGESITAVSCPGAHLCAAVDSTGDVITSIRPARKGSWTVAHVDSSPSYSGGPVLLGISCPSLRLCVAVDYDGNAITSTNPSGGAAAWFLHLIDSGLDYECYHYGGTGPACVPGVVDVSCASVTHCTAIDWAGGILSSSDPTGPETWGGGEQPASESYAHVSCPSTRFCLLSQLYSGQVFTFSGGVLRTGANLRPSGVLDGVWCQSARLCLAVGQGVFESLDPTVARPSWKRTYPNRHRIDDIACPSGKLCIAAESNGGILVGTVR